MSALNPAASQPSRARFPLLSACFFLSGLAALMYQVAWTREFAFVFGTSELAVATVLAAYMGGLALGAAIAGRWVGRVRRPVLVYGVLELAIALCALAVPSAIQLSTQIYARAFSSGAELVPSGGGMAALFFLACSLAILVVPTALMGATLPLLVRQAVRHSEELGPRVGRLYAANTLGAVFGTLLAGFVLMPALGLRVTIWCAVAVNGLVFLAAAALARVCPALPVVETRPKASGEAHSAWVLVLMAVSGCISFCYEVLWTRLLSHILGGSVYAFTTMLASFLIGIALGSMLGARFARERDTAVRSFAWIQIGIGLLSYLAFRGLDGLPALAQQLGGAQQLAPSVLIAMLVLLPSALCIGATFPLAVRILGRDSEDAGPASARVYAWNTVGAIVGALAAGFFIVPQLGYANTLVLAVVVNLLLAIATRSLGSAVTRRALVAASLALLAVVAARPEPPWNVLRTGALGGSLAVGEVDFYAVGRSATVAVFQTDEGWQIRTNGLPESVVTYPGTRVARYPVAHWLGALPSLVRPDAESMLVVGLGGGVVVEKLPPSLQRVDIIELEAQVVEANRALATKRAADPLADPRIHITENDARASLLLTQRRFDALVSQPSHPWTAGAAHLYTQEFFELVRSRLTDDGVFVQWMGLRFVDADLLQRLLATLTEVFDHVAVVSPRASQAVLFLGSQAPLTPRASAKALVTMPDYYAELGLRVPEDFAARWLLDDTQARRFAGDTPPNRDDHNFLQTRSPRLGPKANLLAQGGVAPLWLDFNPWLIPPAEFDATYWVRTLALQGMPERAERIARALPEESTRQIATALAQSGPRSKPGRRVAALNQALDQHPHSAPLRAVYLQLRRDAQAAGEAVPKRIATPLSANEELLLQSWRLAHAADFTGLRALDAKLAQLAPRDPWFSEATRMRAAWRAELGSTSEARQARDWMDALLAQDHTDRGFSRDVLLRAELGLRAGDPGVVVESLRDLGLRPRALQQTGLRRKVKSILDRLPEDPVWSTRAELLRQRMSGTRRRRPPTSD